MVLAKQALAVADPAGVFPHHYPSVAAASSAIEHLEQVMSVTLDAEHRSFLSFADGWRGFFHSVDLLSIAQLGEGEGAVAKALLDDLPDALFDSIGTPRDSLLPIAASEFDIDIFVMPIAAGTVLPLVTWLAGEEVDRFTSFASFFESMIQYNLDTIRGVSTPGA